MLVTPNKQLQTDFEIQLEGKTLKHKHKVKLLGNTLTQDLEWETQVKTEIIPNLRNRIRTLRIMTKYIPTKFRVQYITATFRSKLHFGLETWGGTQKTLISKIQSLQDQATKLALQDKNYNLTATQRQRLLNWLPVEQEIKFSTFKMAHRILNTASPEEISSQMPRNTQGHRIQAQNKFAQKPKWLNQNKTTRDSIRNRMYHYNTLPGRLTELTDHKKFKKETKKYLMEKINL